jgi:two-component system CheB/CheR fusion protein
LFAALDKKHRVYVRKLTVRAPLALPLPSPLSSTPVLPKFPAFTLTPAPPDAPLPTREPATPAFNEVHLRLLEQYAPPSVLVNSEYEILHLSQHAGRMLRFTGGKVSTNLIDVVLPELRLELRSALFRAVQSGESVDVPGLPVKLGDKVQMVDIRVRPLLDSERPDAPVSYLLVIFADREMDDSASTVLGISEEDALTRRLEAELLHLKDHLRSTVEQYEATTEELKASNEELQAMNEELRSASEGTGNLARRIAGHQ